MGKTILDRRNTGERRWGLESDFPVKDCNGALVMTERRCLPDRRLENTTFEERLLMFSGQPQTEAE
jgi:hypothetical protein